MSIKIYFILFLLMTACLGSVAYAGGKAIPTMANVMIHLNHFPSDAEKATLNKLMGAKSTAANEKILAQAIMNLQHSVSDADKPKLKKMIQANETKSHERDLASIILNIAHQPSAADKKKLQAMMH